MAKDSNIVEKSFSELANFQGRQKTALETLFNPQCKYLLYGGAGGGGKSYFLRWSALALLMYYHQKYGIEGVQIGLFSEDYPTLKDRQIGKIKREFPEYLGTLKDDRDEGYIFQLKKEYGGGMILLRNLDDPSKYASAEFAAIFVEELTKNSLETFEDLRFRLRYAGIPEVKFVGATNPGGIGHAWVKNLWINKDPKGLDREGDRFFFVPARVTDNKYIDADYIKQLESLPEKKRKRLLEGSWDIFEGQVFSEFSRDIHVCRPIVPKLSAPHYFWADWGYSETSAFAGYASAVIRMKTEDGDEFNRVITYQEWYGNLKTPDEWAEIIYKSAICKKFELGVVDPAMTNRQTDGSHSIGQLFEKKWSDMHGGHWLGLVKGSNDRVKRVAMIHNWLSIAPDGLPYWMITENCKNLIRTLPELVYDENLEEAYDTKQEDHSADSISYGLSRVPFIGLTSGGVKLSLIHI